MFKYKFDKINTPTLVNLSRVLEINKWSNTTRECHFSAANLSTCDADIQILEHKQKLAALVTEHCPWVSPPTVGVDELNYETIIRLVNKYFDQQPWILKPSLLNNGTGLVILPRIEKLASYFSSNVRYSGSHVLQQYIHPPDLINECKYSIRCFVILTNYGGCYLYKHGYYNVCKAAYDFKNIQCIQSHLTNEHLEVSASTNYQIPTSIIPDYKLVLEKIFDILKSLLSAFDEETWFFEPNPSLPGIAFLGVDFMRNQKGETYLLEVNHGPCFPVNEYHPLFSSLYIPFWQAVYEDFLLPIATKNYLYIPSNIFTPINFD